MDCSVDFLFRGGVFNLPLDFQLSLCSVLSQPLQDDNGTVTALFCLLQLPAHSPACIGIQLACVFISLKSL